MNQTNTRTLSVVNRIVAAIIISIVVLLSHTRAASAQTPAPLSSDETRFSIAAGGGIAAVQNVGGTAIGTLSYRLTDRVAAIGEGVWMQDVASRRRIETAETVATYLQTSQGKAATGTLEIPSFMFGGGVRFMLTKPGRVRPYFSATAGVVRMSLQPTFTLAGTDVTSTLPSYGVTLGSDLTGEETKAAFGGSLGVIVDQGRWYIAGGLRLTSIQTDGQATNVLGAGGGIGFKF